MDGVDNAREDFAWFAELMGNFGSALVEFLPWWVWPTLVLVLLTVMLSKSKGAREMGKRFALGLPMDGRPKTDATMWSAATRKLEGFTDINPGPWHDKPYAVRALIRWGVVVWFLALVGGYLGGSSGYVTGAWVVFVAAVAVPFVLGVIRWRRQLHRAAKDTARWARTHRHHLRLPARAGGAPLALASGEGAQSAEMASGGAVAVREGSGSAPAPRSPEEAVAAAQAAPPAAGQVPLTAEEAEEARQRAADAQLVEDSARDMHSEILMPLWGGVRLALELSRKQKAQDWITLPPSVDVDDAQVIIRLPQEWQGIGEEKARLDHAVKTRLPGEWDSSYRLAGAKHTVTFRKVPFPPGRVHVKDVWPLIASASPTAPVFAIGPRGVPITADLVADSPHIAISMGSGAGKSTLVRALLAQMLYHGAKAYIMDIKRTSHRWANGLKNAKIYKDIEDIHDALVYLGEEADRRHRAQDDEDIDFPRMVVVVEEMNILADALEDYWEECKESAKADGEKLPNKSPAFKGLTKIAYGGRSADANIIAIAQKLDARLFGSRSGGAARENFALRIMARFTHQAWKQLADIKPMAKLAKILGRVAVISQGSWNEAQVIFWPEEVARAHASSGTVTPVSQVPVTATVVSEKHPPNSEVSQDGLSQDWIGDSDPRPATTTGEDREKTRDALDLAPWDIEPEKVEETEIEEAEIVENRSLVTQVEAFRKLRITSATYDNFRQIYRRERKKGMAPEPVQDGSNKKWDLDEIAEWWNDYEAEKLK